MKIRFIHTADLHLDTPFKGLSDFNKELADKLKDATFDAFKRIVNCCIDNKVDFLVISGDIFDSEIKSISAQLRFVHELERLSKSGIPTYFNCGNHDFLSSWLDTLHLPELVFRFSSSLGCFTYNKDGKELADIYGISFENKVVKENLALKYKRKDNPAPISIAVYHGTIGPSGGHESYAQFEISDIQNENFDYWALGHIHKRSTIQKEYPTIVYPGNPQGRDFGESGPKGCYLVEIEPGQVPHLEFIPLQIVRFEKITVDLTGVNSINDISRKITDTTDNLEGQDDTINYILRVELIGKTIVHAQLSKESEAEELRDSMNDGQLLQTPFLWIDRINVRTRPEINLDEIRSGNDFPAELVKLFDSISEDPARLRALIQEEEGEITSVQIKKELNSFTLFEENELLQESIWLLLDQILTQ